MNRPLQMASLLAVAALGASAAPAAMAAPAISGADGDVWNASNPTPVYVITGVVPRVRIFWEVGRVDSDEVDSDDGRSPETVRLSDIEDDGSYRLVAREVSRDNPDVAVRTFRVDVTPPGVTIRQPASGARIQQGSTVTADYSCDGAISCIGTVAAGAPLDTSRAGPATLSVRAVDDAGNAVTGSVDYIVRPSAAGAAPAPVTPPAAPAPAPPSTPAAPLPPAQATGQSSRPPTLNALSLLPRAGARVATRRPVLRWRARKGARFYNVQVFRLRGDSVTKVVSVFPRRNRLRISAGRVSAGDRYRWRVWPYLARGYQAKPLGMSYFDVRPSAAR